MNLPTPQNTISWNAAFSLVFAIVAAAIAWGAMENRVSQIDRTLNEERERRVELRNQVASLRAEAASDRIDIARIQEQLSALVSSNSRIEANLERLVRTYQEGRR